MANKKLRFVALIAVVLMLVCMLVACTTTATSSVSYKVTIHSDGQSDIVWDRQTDFPTLSKEHHTVAGLYLDAEYKTAVTPEDLVNMFLTGDIDVYVKYDRIHYSITVHPLNGGSDVIWQNAPGNKIPEFKKAGYVMSGFYFDENCTQPADSVFTEDILENKEVWVKWVECDHKALAPTDWTTDKKATCTEDGHMIATCPTCDKTLEDTIDALGHNTEGSIAHKDADCTNSGVVGGTYCTRCNNGKDAAETTIPVDPTKHSFGVWVDEVPATCVSTGTKGHKDCTVCKKSFTANNVEITDLTINATGHSYGNVVYVWADDYSTCTAKHVCENGTCEHEETATATVSPQKTQEATCQQVELTKYTATFTASWAETQVVEDVQTAGKANHNYSEDWTIDKGATCTEDGSKSHHCLTEGCDSKSDVTTIEASHTFGEWVDEVPAKCETDGTLGHYHCSVCKANFDAQYKELKSITISATRHKPTQLRYDDDNHWYACEKVGCTYTTQKVAHTWDKGEQTTAPTETEEGVKTYKCTVCWQKKTENTGKLDHEHTFDTTKWSTDDGHHWHPATCAHTDEKDGYAEHTYGDVTYTWSLDNTTCTAVHSCKCGYSESETATVTKDVTQAATCTLPEISTLTATFENTAFATQTKTDIETGKALGHDSEGLVDHKDATCTETGVKGGTYCTRCNDGKDAAKATINALGHNSEGSVDHKDATCTNSGVVGGTYCTRCNDGKDAAEATINALGHNSDGSVDHKDATCTNSGVVGGTYCTRCNDGKDAAEATINALGHNSEGSVDHKDATCTSSGVVGGTYCTRCDYGKADAETTINALGHNSDGSVDHKDATCTNSGVVGGTYCTRCNDGKDAAEATINALGHNSEGSVDHKDATCTSSGVVGGTYCTRCNDGKDAAEATINALGHNSEGSVDHKDATCTETGVKGGTYCTRCNDGKDAAETTIPVDSTKHNYGEWVSNNGTHTKTCTYNTEHTVTDACSGGTATCTEKAECTVCGEKYGELDQHTLGILVNETTAKIDSNGNFVNGMKAHYQCSTCEQYFNAEQEAATEDDLTIAFDSTKHYSVVEIIELTKDIAKGNNTEEMLYVKGIVKSGFTNNNTYVQQLYIIDENDSEKEFLVYTCSFTTEIPTIYAGDTVVVYGYIKNYNNTLEVATANEKNATFVSREAGTGTIAVDESVKNATVAITNNQTTGTNGTTFTFTVTASEGYEIASVKVNDTAVEAVDGTYTGTIQGTTIITVETQEAGLTVVATFEFVGEASTSTGHKDGSALAQNDASWTDDDYTLTFTDLSNVYKEAFDAKGNSALKLGTSKVVGSFTFTAPDNVTKVVIYVAQYKKNNTTVTINGTNYVINTASDDGSYTAITIDVSTTKTVSLATVSDTPRCMIDKIEYYAVESGTEGGGTGEGGSTDPVEPATTTLTMHLYAPDWTEVGVHTWNGYETGAFGSVTMTADAENTGWWIYTCEVETAKIANPGINIIFFDKINDTQDHPVRITTYTNDASYVFFNANKADDNKFTSMADALATEGGSTTPTTYTIAYYAPDWPAGQDVYLYTYNGTLGEIGAYNANKMQAVENKTGWYSVSFENATAVTSFSVIFHATDEAIVKHEFYVENLTGNAFYFIANGNNAYTTEAEAVKAYNANIKYKVNYTDSTGATLTVKAGETVIASGADVLNNTVLTITATSTESTQKVSGVKVNGSDAGVTKNTDGSYSYTVTGNITSITVELKELKGTSIENAYTVEELWEEYGELTHQAYSTQKVYVKGVVATVPTYNTNKASYTFVIKTSADAEQEVKGYSVKLSANISAVYQNDEVVMYGYVEKFNKELEITYKDSEDGFIVQLNSGISSISYEENENADITLGKTTGMNGTTFTFTVTASEGYVVQKVTVNDETVEADENSEYQATIKGNTIVKVVTQAEGDEGGGTGTVTTVTMAYSGGSTTNMEADSNNASKVGLDGSIFTVTSEKTNNNGTQVGLNKDGEIRIYGTNKLTVSVGAGYVINSITITLASGTSTLVVSDGTKTISETNGEYSINGSKFVITNSSSTQVKVKSITITYKKTESGGEGGGSTGTEGGDEGGSTIDPIDPTDPTPTVTRLELTSSTLFADVSGTGYAQCDGTHKVNTYDVTTSNVCVNNGMQLKKNSGTITVKKGTFSKVTINLVKTWESGLLSVTVGDTTVKIDATNVNGSQIVLNISAKDADVVIKAGSKMVQVSSIVLE